MLPDLAKELGTWSEHPGLSLDGKPLPKLKGKPTYTIKFRKGQKYENDICLDPNFEQPATREITAADFAYSIRRQADPTIKHKGGFLVGSIVGFEDYRKILRKQLSKLGKVDVTSSHYSIDTPNSHTLRLTLENKSSAIEYLFVTWFASPVPAECVAYYHGQNGRPAFRQKSISSGPYKLTNWQLGHSMTLVQNENYRKEIYPDQTAGSKQERKKGFFKDSGRTLPIIKKLFFRIFS